MGLLNILFYDDEKQYVLTESGSLFEMNPKSWAELKNNPNKRVYVSKYRKGKELAKGTETYLAEEELHSCFSEGKKYVIYEASVLRDPDNRYDEASWDYGFIYTVFEGKSVMEACNDIKKREVKLKMSSEKSVILMDYKRDKINQSKIDDYVHYTIRGKGVLDKKTLGGCRIASAMAMIIYKLKSQGMSVKDANDVVKIYIEAREKKDKKIIYPGDFDLGNEAGLAELYNPAAKFHLSSNKPVDENTKYTIIEELNKGNPVMALFEYHTEVIYGYNGEEDVFLVDDVGYQGDVTIHPDKNWQGQTILFGWSTEPDGETNRCLKNIKCII